MASNKTPPFNPYPKWTTAKFFGFIRSGLREKFNRWPPKYEVLIASRKAVPVLDEEGNEVIYKTGRKAGEVKLVNVCQCSECKEWYKQKDVQVDHIKPAGSLRTFEDLPKFASNLFCGVEDLQVLCTTCHQKKTNKERSE